MTLYVSVPPTIYAPPPEPPRSGGESRAHHRSTAQRTGHPEGAAPSSCTIQEHNFLNPSDIAKDSLKTLLSLPQTDPRHQYDQLCIDFVGYLDQCEQKGFMIKGYDTKTGKMLNLPMSYNNRWGPVRRRELSDKLERLNFWFEMQEDRPCTMITLTCYHEGKTISQAWHELNKSRGKLLKLIANYYGNVDYFWVPEPHKSGYVHYHLAVFAQVDNTKKDKNGEGIEDKFRRLWSKKYETGSHTFGLDFSHKKGDSKIQHLKNYLSKYLEKGFLMKSWSTGMLLFNTHLWETGFRMYGASKNIRSMMNITDDDNDQGDIYAEWKDLTGTIIDKHTGKTQLIDELFPEGYAELEIKYISKKVIWLETKMQTLEHTPDGEPVSIEKVIWYRQYIPDWIDSDRFVDLVPSGSYIVNKKPFWNKLRKTDPPPLYFCDWGRRTQYTAPLPIKYDPQAARKLRNKDTAW